MTRKNTPSAVQSLVLSAALFTGLSAQAQPAPIYRNDFAVRLSAGQVAAKTYTLPYLTGTLCSTNGLAAYSDTSAIQDGWVEGLNNNDAIARVLDTGGNPLACLCRDVYGNMPTSATRSATSSRTAWCGTAAISARRAGGAVLRATSACT